MSKVSSEVLEWNLYLAQVSACCNSDRGWTDDWRFASMYRLARSSGSDSLPGRDELDDDQLLHWIIMIGGTDEVKAIVSMYRPGTTLSTSACRDALWRR